MNILAKNLLVLASAGSGKTYTLSDRIVELLAKNGTEPDQIVALTFTKKAATEFTDAILRKLAKNAKEQEASDFLEILEKTIQKLPKLNFGTMDGFFGKIVRGFQYELGITGGRFELLQGSEAIQIKEELLEKLLEGSFQNMNREEFIEIFLRATKHQDGNKVSSELQQFISLWHECFLSHPQQVWGSEKLARVDFQEWGKQKLTLIEKARHALESIKVTDKRQTKAFEDIMKSFEDHTIGSGTIKSGSTLFQSIIESLSSGQTQLEISYYRPLTIDGITASALRELIEFAAQCEFSAALSRTRAIYRMIEFYDDLIEKHLRSQGKLEFHDIKKLIGSWTQGEEERLRREAIDFRLDARYEHWLLDEFQDTSRQEWNAIFPLLDEGFTKEESTVFIVGDKKQAIYGWRGGDVSLFNEISERYSGGIESETMAESWRSCPEVLDPVNKIFGDTQTIQELFSDSIDGWEWQDHVSAGPLQDTSYQGHAKFEIVDEEEKMNHLISHLHALGVGKKEISCGVLVSTNEQVKTYSDAFREAGFQVVEEGVREPSKDHPVGILIMALLHWLANPADSLARCTIEMSPISDLLNSSLGSNWQDRWLGLNRQVSEIGYSGMIQNILAPLVARLGSFGKKRFEILHQELIRLDQKGIISAKEISEKLKNFQISQSPGIAAIQVMTIHKSKGLGFDVVFIPDVSNSTIPNFQHFRHILSDTWISMTPSSWVRKVLPVLRHEELLWKKKQTYESFCKLYVAMTRAKRGLYVFLEISKDHKAEEKASYTQWIMNSLSIHSGQPCYEIGNPDWSKKLPDRKLDHKTAATTLGEAVPKRKRKSPSKHSELKSPNSIFTRKNQQWGTKWHAALESFTWCDDPAQSTFTDHFSDSLEKLLDVPEIRNFFSKKRRNIELRREQKFEALIHSEWVSGIIDRLHIHYSDDKMVQQVEIIDFKTDQILDRAEFIQKHTPQLQIYRQAMTILFPGAEIKAYLLATSIMALIEVD